MQSYGHRNTGGIQGFFLEPSVGQTHFNLSGCVAVDGGKTRDGIKFNDEYTLSVTRDGQLSSTEYLKKSSDDPMWGAKGVGEVWTTIALDKRASSNSIYYFSDYPTKWDRPVTIADIGSSENLMVGIRFNDSVTIK